MKKTKIIATLGPASESPEMIETLIKSGVNVFRLNFSHGENGEKRDKIIDIREISTRLNANVAILADLQGPKIRVGEVNTYLKKGEVITFVCDKPNENEIEIQYRGLYKDVNVNDRLLLDDGLLEVKVLEIDEKRIVAKVVTGGKLTPNKGINSPTASISAGVLTDKDIADAKFALGEGVDFLALSFVKNADNINALREIVKESDNPEAGIIAKIERHEAIESFDKILKASDAIMVARGDLGIEVSQQRVPLIQKKIIKKCLTAGKPVIVATQMLDSMIRNPRSTRAETSDIANAILDGADAIMLSGETAVGKYPKEAVRAMNRIAIDTETWVAENNVLIGEHIVHNLNKLPEAVARAAFDLARETKSRYIIAATTTGSNAREIAKFRPYTQVIAGTENVTTARKLSLTWGVWPIVVNFEHNRELTDKITGLLDEKRLVKKGDYITIVSGITSGKIGGTNMIRVHQV